MSIYFYVRGLHSWRVRSWQFDIRNERTAWIPFSERYGYRKRGGICIGRYRFRLTHLEPPFGPSPQLHERKP